MQAMMRMHIVEQQCAMRVLLISSFIKRSCHALGLLAGIQLQLALWTILCAAR